MSQTLRKFDQNALQKPHNHHHRDNSTFLLQKQAVGEE